MFYALGGGGGETFQRAAAAEELFPCIFQWPVLLRGQEPLEWTTLCGEGTDSHSGFRNADVKTC